MLTAVLGCGIGRVDDAIWGGGGGPRPWHHEGECRAYVVGLPPPAVRPRPRSRGFQARPCRRRPRERSRPSPWPVGRRPEAARDRNPGFRSRPGPRRRTQSARWSCPADRTASRPRSDRRPRSCRSSRVLAEMKMSAGAPRPAGIWRASAEDPASGHHQIVARRGLETPLDLGQCVGHRRRRERRRPPQPRPSPARGLPARVRRRRRRTGLRMACFGSNRRASRGFTGFRYGLQDISRGDQALDFFRGKYP